jgi:hypothetical protein
MEDFDLSAFFFTLCLWCVSTAGWAQTNDNDRKSIHLPDSVRYDYEEWLRNEPKRDIVHDSSKLQPLPPQLPVVDPQKLKPKHSPVSVTIMTPALRTDMRLAYQSHWLEEQRKEQKGGAMMVGVNPLSIVAWVVQKIFPKHKSKKQRQREQLQQILDNY